MLHTVHVGVIQMVQYDQEKAALQTTQSNLQNERTRQLNSHVFALTAIK